MEHVPVQKDISIRHLDVKILTSVKVVMCVLLACVVKIDLEATFASVLPEPLGTQLLVVFDQMNARPTHSAPNTSLAQLIHYQEGRNVRIRAMLPSVLAKRLARLSLTNHIALVLHNTGEIQLILILAATKLNANRIRNVLAF